MRLRTLELTAVGPYLETQRVDFAQLSASGIFLFEGPTGSGKSTLLDAITFALYGRTAGSGDKGRLASQYADAGAKPEVTLEFAVNGKIFEVTRSPEHERPKKRGQGTTTERASVLLRELEGGEWVVRSRSHEEAGLIIQRELGLTADQFSQVVLLPQGEFDTFLQAGVDERQKVLTKLFAAHRYDDITRWLRERAAEAGKDRQEAERVVLAARAAAGEAAQLPEEQLAEWREAPLDRLAELLDEHRSRLAAELEVAQHRADELEKKRSTAERALADAEKLAERAGRVTELRSAQERLAAGRAQHEAQAAELATARLAEPVAALLEQLTIAQAAEQRAAADAEARRGEEQAGSAEAARAAAEGQQLAAAALDRLVAVEQELPALRREAREAAGAADEATTGSQALAQRQAELPGAIAGLRSALAGAAHTAAGRGEAELQVQTWSDRAEGARLADQLEDRVAAADLARREAVDAHQAAVDHHQGLVQRRIDGMAGELAAALEPHQPCPVCGSAEHPIPAERGDAVDPEEVEAAQQEAAQFAQERENAERVVADLTSQLAAARAQAAGASAEEAAAELAEAQARLGRAQAAEQHQQQLAAQLAAAEAEQAEVSSRLTEAQQLEAELGAKARAAQQAVADALAEVTAELAGYATVAERLAALLARAARLKALASALEEWERQQQVTRDALKAAETKAREHFEDLDAARAAVRDAESRAALEREIEDYQKESAGVAAGLRSSDLAGISEEDIASAEQRLRDARRASEESSNARDAAVEKRKEAANRVERFTVRAGEVEATLRDQQQVIARTKPVLDMDAYARGISGARRMTLTTFYLRYWFERVLDAANARLRKMADGKYTLLRSDGGAGARDRGGLTLEVLDNHTGKPRAPGTLSGGERFYTSLSLALGLADVVQAEAGGASLDTLFIDEGFGSLDPDRLEEVMKVLNDLRSDQRVVGIVSHVAELKDQIADRIEVRRESNDGPSRLTVRA